MPSLLQLGIDTWLSFSQSGVPTFSAPLYSDTWNTDMMAGALVAKMHHKKQKLNGGGGRSQVTEDLGATVPVLDHLLRLGLCYVMVI